MMISHHPSVRWLREMMAHRKHYVTDPECGRCVIIDRDKRQAELEVMLDCESRLPNDHRTCPCWCHKGEEEEKA